MAVFQPGQSGNPSGRPKENQRVKALAQEYTEEAIQALAAIMRDEAAKPGERRAAATDLLDRAWGKPAQAIVGDNEADPVRLAIGWMTNSGS